MKSSCLLTLRVRKVRKGKAKIIERAGKVERAIIRINSRV